jgi:uncharacterized membrane protein
MPLMRFLLWIAAVIATATATHVALVYATPRVIMSKAMDGLAARAGGVNKPNATPPATAKSRAIVKPSPDLAYTACVYDITAGPILVSGSPSAAYWSIGFYSANSDNFHIVTPATATNGTAGVILAKSAENVPDAPKGMPVVVPPSERGIVLFRYLVLDTAMLADAKRAQSTAVCRSLKDAP